MVYKWDLAEVEVTRRDQNQKKRRSMAACFLRLKEQADLGFYAIPNLDMVCMLDLSRGDYIIKSVSFLLVGNPSLGTPAPHMLLATKLKCNPGEVFFKTCGLLLLDTAILISVLWLGGLDFLVVILELRVCIS